MDLDGVQDTKEAVCKEMDMHIWNDATEIVKGDIELVKIGEIKCEYLPTDLVVLSKEHIHPRDSGQLDKSGKVFSYY